jgi:hypothetical protein
VQYIIADSSTAGAITIRKSKFGIMATATTFCIIKRKAGVKKKGIYRLMPIENLVNNYFLFFAEWVLSSRLVK